MVGGISRIKLKLEIFQSNNFKIKIEVRNNDERQ